MEHGLLAMAGDGLGDESLTCGNMLSRGHGSVCAECANYTNAERLAASANEVAQTKGAECKAEGRISFREEINFLKQNAEEPEMVINGGALIGKWHHHKKCERMLVTQRVVAMIGVFVSLVPVASAGLQPDQSPQSLLTRFALSSVGMVVATMFLGSAVVSQYWEEWFLGPLLATCNPICAIASPLASWMIALHCSTAKKLGADLRPTFSNVAVIASDVIRFPIGQGGDPLEGGNPGLVHQLRALGRVKQPMGYGRWVALPAESRGILNHYTRPWISVPIGFFLVAATVIFSLSASVRVTLTGGPDAGKQEEVYGFDTPAVTLLSWAGALCIVKALMTVHGKQYLSFSRPGTTRQELEGTGALEGLVNNSAAFLVKPENEGVGAKAWAVSILLAIIFTILAGGASLASAFQKPPYGLGCRTLWILVIVLYWFFAAAAHTFCWVVYSLHGSSDWAVRTALLVDIAVHAIGALNTIIFMAVYAFNIFDKSSICQTNFGQSKTPVTLDDLREWNNALQNSHFPYILVSVFVGPIIILAIYGRGYWVYRKRISIASPNESEVEGDRASISLEIVRVPPPIE